ncbi:hypothetical protein [Priestia endophytica]|uniref:hypothetical protein n=1 Tax=Priestia endophytica TaxID=135735 RepID=UPI002281422D|nr:hypothetical protein [Priestia endophytica]MCY8232884.1 hypothetical protein [Priestia endophytica]
MEGKLIVAVVQENVMRNNSEDSLEYTRLDLYDNKELDNGFNEILTSHSFEKEKIVKNLREKTAMLTNLLKPGFEISYGYPPRPKFEVFGGYKIAKRRQASLAADFSKVKIYNLYFRYSNGNGLGNLNTSAMVYRNKQEEVILLSPQDTKQENSRLTNTYKNIATDLVLKQGSMNPDEQSKLLDNLKLLTVNERCAQSLQHEYGHILHGRLFDSLGLKNAADIYNWFFQHGYAHLMNKRSPEFQSASSWDKVYLLKESLVEDYRIWLNMKDNNDMFILPNINTYYGDFITPDLLKEGVILMKKMLNDAINNSFKTNQTENFSGEPNRILRSLDIYEKASSTNWKPGSNTMSEQDHLQVMEDLKSLDFDESKLEHEQSQVMAELKEFRKRKNIRNPKKFREPKELREYKELDKETLYQS